MPYPEMEDVEKFRLTFIRCLKLPQLVDMIPCAQATPRCVSSRIETFEDYVYWFVETRTRAKGNRLMIDSKINVVAFFHRLYFALGLGRVFTHRIFRS